MEATKNNPERHAIKLSNLWQRYGPNSYPMDLDALVAGAISSGSLSDHLEVVREGFDSFEGSLVRVKGTRKWAILLNTQVENERRRRFTFAHELGHFMCHRELREKFVDSEDTLNDFQTEIETEANIFASWLLMPANLLREEFSDYDWQTETLRAIGNRFDCSLQASALRYVQLSSRPVAFVVSRDGTIIWAKKSESAPYMLNYRFGDDLPPGSHALECHTSGDDGTERQAVGPVWSSWRPAFESQYFDSSRRGFQYTCIEFQ